MAAEQKVPLGTVKTRLRLALKHLRDRLCAPEARIMTPTHHPADELLVEYAAGETAEAVSLVIACHATLCPPCRQRLAELEVVGGALLEQAPPRELRPGALEAVLAALDAEGDTGETTARKRRRPRRAPHRRAPCSIRRGRCRVRCSGTWMPPPRGSGSSRACATSKAGRRTSGELLRLVNLRPA